MGYVEFLVQTPWFWVFAAALSLAAALRCFLVALIPRHRTRRGGRTSSAAGLFLLSIALVLLTLAVFVPGPHRILEPALAVFAAGVMVVGLVVFLFPLLVGLPMFLLLTLSLVLFSGYLQNWNPIHRASDVAQLRVISAREGRLVVEVIKRDQLQWEEPLGRTVELQGAALGATVELLELHPAYFLLGRQYSFRFQSLRGYDFDHAQADFIEVETLDLQTVIAGRTLSPGSRFETVIRQGRVPGTRTAVIEARPRRIGVLTAYALYLAPPDHLVIEARN